MSEEFDDRYYNSDDGDNADLQTPVIRRDMRNRVGRPRRIPSDEEHELSELELEFYEQESSIEDFDTESQEEDVSDHICSVGEIDWIRSEVWSAQVRRNPECEKFVG